MIAIAPVEAGTSRRPGEVLEIEGEWELDYRPSVREARLIWYTQGKSTTEVRVVEKQKTSSASKSGRQRFQFTLPEWPYSYNGVLFRVLWAVELAMDQTVARWEFTLGPDGKAIEVVDSTL